jgi:hypothetical protein
MHGQEGAQPGIDRMAEAQHATLPQQDVVAQADDDQVAGLRQHGERQAAFEHHGRDDEQQRVQRPQQPAADVIGFELVVWS